MITNDQLLPLLQCFHKNLDNLFLEWETVIWKPTFCSFFYGKFLLKTLTQTVEKSGHESNRHTSSNLSTALKLLLFWRKKKSISYGCMGTDQFKTRRNLTGTGRPSQAFCHTMKWSNVKIYYSYYYKYIYKKINHFYLWILQGRIDLVNKVLSHVCTYLVLIRISSLCWSFSVSHYLMVQYEKKIWKLYEYYWSILYCIEKKNKNYVVSILTGQDKLQLCIQV